MYEHVFVMSTPERVLGLRAHGLSLTHIARELGLVQAYYDAGHSITQCQDKFGFSRETWNTARKRGAVRSRLLSAGLLLTHRYEFGITEWRGRPLSPALHHINGNGDDNRLDNLQLLCPSCH